ncbi:hypothetical protein [Corynebacterium variabile]|uniref:hypothetical protein n=1 Tax=Corynebacterium variabile TaxID=1727 RepID=UPI003FD1406C
MSEREEGERGLSDQDLTRLMDSDRSVRDRMSKVEKWDDLHPNGEGKVPTGAPFYNYDFHEYVQWVRVTRGRDNQRVVATFLLWWREGKPWRMGIAVAHRGLPPNPYEHRFLSMFDWWAVNDLNRKWGEDDPTTAEEELRATEDEERELRGLAPLTDEERAMRREQNRGKFLAEGQRYAGAGWWGMTGTPGARPTIEVSPIPAGDGDHRWRFPEGDGSSFKVRGSLLAQALFTLRMSGQQRVSVYTLRETVERIQQG